MWGLEFKEKGQHARWMGSIHHFHLHEELTDV
jgi:hypothetical protein